MLHGVLLLALRSSRNWSSRRRVGHRRCHGGDVDRLLRDGAGVVVVTAGMRHHRRRAAAVGMRPGRASSSSHPWSSSPRGRATIADAPPRRELAPTARRCHGDALQPSAVAAETGRAPGRASAPAPPPPRADAPRPSAAVAGPLPCREGEEKGRRVVGPTCQLTVHGWQTRRSVV